MRADIPLSDEQLKIVGLIGVLALAVVAAPMLLMPSDDAEIEPNNGTVVTPDGTELQEVDGGVDRGPLGGLNAIPASHLRDDESPTVHASAGAQTMRVETTTVNGEPALNLTDERTHDGRWVSVPTDWFNETQGSVPSVARIAHEENGTYTEAIQVRGDSAAFYVRSFSTNTVTFGGELVIRDRPAVDGTRHTYQLDSRDSVDNLVINATGVNNANSREYSVTDTGTVNPQIGGNVQPPETTISVEGNGFGSRTVTGSKTSATDGYSTSLDLVGTLTDTNHAETPTIDVTGVSTTQTVTESGSGSASRTVDGNTPVQGTVSVDFDDVERNRQNNNPGQYISGTGSSTFDVQVPAGDYIKEIKWEVSGDAGSDWTADVAINGDTFATGETLDGYTDTVYGNDYNPQQNGGTVTVEVTITNRDLASGEATDSGDITQFDVITETTQSKGATVSSGSNSVSLNSDGSKTVQLDPSDGFTISQDANAPFTWDVDYTAKTVTRNPEIIVNGETVSYSGDLTSGQTTSLTVPNSALNPGGSNSLSLGLPNPSGPQMEADLSWSIEELDGTVAPSVDTDGDGAAEVSSGEIIANGDTVTSVIQPSAGSMWSISADGNAPTVSATITEQTVTTDPVVELNGQTVSYNGTLAEGETVDLGGSVSWLEDGQNNVTVRVGDGSYSGDGPEPQVELEYRHDLESPRTVDYESEALSERYNISKTYTTPRANATLTIPHARTVVSMRTLDYRLNETESWSSVPQSAANLSGTTIDVDVSALAGDPVPEGTTIEVRSTGSRVDAYNSEISVVRATPVGFDMNSRVQLDSWNSGSYLEVGETPQGGLVYYAENETYTAESDYVELYSNGDQRFYAPNASSGSELTLNTLSARVSPERNSMRVRVPESVNATNTEFVVEPASVVGDSWTAEYVAGTDGQWYAVVDGSGEELGAAEKPDPITVNRDDVGLVSIEPTDPPSQSTDSVGGGIFATATTGNLPSLIVLFGSVAMLFVAGTRPTSSRDAVNRFAAGVAGLVGRVPRIGDALDSAVESGLSSTGSGLVTVGENRLLTGAIGAAVAVAAAEAGLFSIGSEAGAIIAVAGIAVGSLFLLRQSGEFTAARWIAIVGIAGVVALQGLGEGDLLTEFVNSDAFLIAVLIGGYALIQLVREYRANNAPDDDQPQIVIGGRFSNDDEGSD